MLFPLLPAPSLRPLQTKHLPREDFGLSVERQGPMGNTSLFKMEQRLSKMGMLNRPALAMLLEPTRWGD